MNSPEYIKPAVFGAVAGAVALAVVGFSWGGWMTAGKAEEMASRLAGLEVIAALVPICVAQSNDDPQLVETLAKLKDANTYLRRDMLMETGWATMPGSSDPNGDVARACVDKLSTQF